MLISLTKQNATEILEKSAKPVIIDFFASWCGPCMILKPHFEALAAEFVDSYVFAEVNVDAVRDLTIEFNVTSIPTLIFIKDKKVVWRHTGSISRDDLKAKIQEYL